MENVTVSFQQLPPEFDNIIIENNGVDLISRDGGNDQSAIKISSCSRDQLLEMLAILEAELQARDVAIATLQNEKLRHMLYEAKFGHGCLDDPYLALERDGAVLGEDLEEDMLMRAAHEAKLLHLENLLVSQRSLVEKVRAQVQLYQMKYSGVCDELSEERKKRTQETSQSEKTIQSWEMETKKLKDELTYEKGCAKAYQEDLALTISIVEAMRLDIAKHKKVALLLIKERKLLAECLLKDRQRLKEIEEAALNDDRTNIERAIEEKLSKAIQDRAVVEDRLKQEEIRHKTTRSECDRLRQQVDFLQQQLQQQQLQWQVAGQSAIGRQSSPLNLSSTDPIRSSSAVLSSGSAAVQRSIASTTPSSFTVTSRVPLDSAPVIAQRALAPVAVATTPSYSSYRSPAAAVVSSSPSIVVGSSSVQPFQNQINLQPNRSPAVASPATIQSTTPVTPTSALNAGGGPKLNFLPGQSAVLTTSSGQRISLHVSPSKPVTPVVVPSPGSLNNTNMSPMIVHVSQATPQLPNVTTPNRPGSGSALLNNSGTIRGSTPQLVGSQRPVPPTPLSPPTNNTQAASVAVSSSFNITIRPDNKGISTFVGASPSSIPPEPPARFTGTPGGSSNGSGFPTVPRAQPNLASPNPVASSSPGYQLDSPTESGRYMTIKKIGVATTTHSFNN